MYQRNIVINKYKISVLLAEIFNSSGLKASQFVKNLGYKNINKGVKNLDMWLRDGAGSELIISGILKVYPQYKDEISIAFKETKLQIKAEKILAKQEKERRDRRNFKPYIFVETSLKIPTSIAFTALTGASMRFIKLDSSKKELSEVTRIINKHYIEKKGKCLFFGDITAYRYINDYDEQILINTKGEVLKKINKHFVVPFSCGASLYK